VCVCVCVCVCVINEYQVHLSQLGHAHVIIRNSGNWHNSNIQVSQGSVATL